MKFYVGIKRMRDDTYEINLTLAIFKKKKFHASMKFQAIVYDAVAV